ncbi:MAG: hypothetical protein GY810_31655 [Aureispira sp.]|nr:hypothetical protein [Aureispira sp.]
MSEKKKKVAPKKEGISCVGMIAVLIFIFLVIAVIGFSYCAANPVILH